MAKRRNPAYLSIVECCSQDFQNFRLRALVYEYPGGQDTLVVERIEFGDEAEMWHLAERRTVSTEAVNTVRQLRWQDDRLYFVLDPEHEEEPVRCYVTANKDKIARKARIVEQALQNEKVNTMNCVREEPWGVAPQAETLVEEGC